MTSAVSCLKPKVYTWRPRAVGSLLYGISHNDSLPALIISRQLSIKISSKFVFKATYFPSSAITSLHACRAIGYNTDFASSGSLLNELLPSDLKE